MSLKKRDMNSQKGNGMGCENRQAGNQKQSKRDLIQLQWPLMSMFVIMIRFRILLGDPIER